MSDDVFFCYCISKTAIKNEFGQNPEENIILTGPGSGNILNIDRLANKDK